MGMVICGGCGGFIMEGWERCRLCGHDRPEPPDRPAAPTPAATTPAPRPPGSRLVLIGAVALAVLAGYLVLGPGDDDGTDPVATASETDPDAPTSTPPPVAATTSAPVTAPGDTAPDEPAVVPPTTAPAPVAPPTATPPPNRADGRAYSAAIAAVGGAYFPGRAAAWGCAGDLTLGALGGADALVAQGLTPADFDGRDLAPRLVVPAGAVDAIAAGLGGCGIDHVELLLPDVDPSQVPCLRAGLDHVLANEALAHLLVGNPSMYRPSEDSNPPFWAHYMQVGLDCLGA